MSVINSMLRDLDRRHAPLPVKTHTQPTSIQTRRTWPRFAFALCALIIVVIWCWEQPSQKNIYVPAESIRPQQSERVTVAEVPANAIAAPVPKEVTAIDSSPIAAPTPAPAIASAPATRPQEEKKQARENSPAIIEQPSIVKQKRTAPDALNDERYQLARAALAQNQPQRAYELLRDNPPPLANATDYHAVLAAVEQQLGHYADASLRYQQLLMLDQNQASWWLGFALSLEGEHRNSEALAAYRHAAALNSLSETVRQYVTGRIAALSATSDK